MFSPLQGTRQLLGPRQSPQPEPSPWGLVSAAASGASGTVSPTSRLGGTKPGDEGSGSEESPWGLGLGLGVRREGRESLG